MAHSDHRCVTRPMDEPRGPGVWLAGGPWPEFSAVTPRDRDVDFWYGIGRDCGVMAAASIEHQGMCKLVSEHPGVLLTLMQRALGVDIPGNIELLPAPETVREIRYPEHHVDSAVVLRRTTDGALLEALVTEMQRQPDDEKHWSWPIHVAGTRARLRCPTTLVVLTGDERTARWAAEPIDLGRGQAVLQPLVIGPSQVPSALELEDARRNPELATLAVIVHGRSTGSKRLGKVAMQAVHEGLDTDTKRYSLLADLIAACLDEQALKEIEDEMELQTSPPFSKWAREHFFAGLRDGREEGLRDGRQEGLRQAIVLVLASRGLVPSDGQREQLARCTDGARLEAWLRQASVVGAVDLLFDSPA